MQCRVDDVNPENEGTMMRDGLMVKFSTQKSLHCTFSFSTDVHITALIKIYIKNGPL